ncbi:enolase [Striga asiatica]|uniref:Enolase n=1 Tax=Striga asiatica TaxID=4170 RepID=A0A5A7QNW3_STRAF|nr:enolase [Striga asiatica]
MDVPMPPHLLRTASDPQQPRLESFAQALIGSNPTRPKLTSNPVKKEIYYRGNCLCFNDKRINTVPKSGTAVQLPQTQGWEETVQVSHRAGWEVLSACRNNETKLHTGRSNPSS